MNSQVINILSPFLALFGTYIHSKTHKMLSNHVGPMFKNQEYVNIPTQSSQFLRVTSRAFECGKDIRGF